MTPTTALALYRALTPRARRTAATAIIHSGGNTRIFGCVCGDQISMCSQFPVTQRVQRWRDTHAACLVLWAEAHRPYQWRKIARDWRRLHPSVAR